MLGSPHFICFCHVSFKISTSASVLRIDFWHQFIIFSVRVLALHPSSVSQIAAVSEAFMLAAFDFVISQLHRKKILSKILKLLYHALESNSVNTESFQVKKMYVSRLTLRTKVKAATIRAHFFRALGARRKLTLCPK